jgi:hypothetical protein
MIKLRRPACETILKTIGGVIVDEGFIGTGCGYNNQISSPLTHVKRAARSLKTRRILFRDYRKTTGDIPASFRTAISLCFLEET